MLSIVEILFTWVTSAMALPMFGRSLNHLPAILLWTSEQVIFQDFILYRYILSTKKVGLVRRMVEFNPSGSD